MNFIPSGDRALIEPCVIGEQTAGGVYMPETARYRTREGIVKAIGPGRTTYSGVFVPVKHQAGQRIVYTPYAGTEIKLDGVDYLVLSDDDILGIVSAVEAQGGILCACGTEAIGETLISRPWCANHQAEQASDVAAQTRCVA